MSGSAEAEQHRLAETDLDRIELRSPFKQQSGLTKGLGIRAAQRRLKRRRRFIA